MTVGEEAVSYTHLYLQLFIIIWLYSYLVYVQLQDLMYYFILTNTFLNWWHYGYPLSVSYTHLDVYKRQQ